MMSSLLCMLLFDVHVYVHVCVAVVADVADDGSVTVPGAGVGCSCRLCCTLCW